MASIYARGDVLWMKFKNKLGKPECRSTGYRRGQEALARELADEVERQAAIERGAAPPPQRFPRARREKPAKAVLPLPTPIDTSAPLVSMAPTDLAVGSNACARIGDAAAPGELTVREYGEQWLQRRVDLSSYRDEVSRLRLHVFPLIGHMAVAAVRPRHIRDLVNAVKEKVSVSQTNKGEKLAPRTVRLVFAVLRVMFKSAVIDEHIASSPVFVEKGVLPKNVDKDPEWRSTAVFERDELIALVSDPRIADYRRLFYGFEGIAGVRHSEAAALRWRDYHAKCEPLAKLVVSRSGEKKRTKTQHTREIPVHPSLAIILAEWRATGWAEKYGREPTPDDLILPTEKNRIRKASNTLKDFKKDLARVGFRRRRGHDLRRTFVSLTQADGGRPEVLRHLTHPGERDVYSDYTTWPWRVICEEILKMRLPLPGVATPPSDGGTNESGSSPTTDSNNGAAAPTGAASAIDRDFAAPTASGVAGYSASYSLDCSSGFPLGSNDLSAATQLGQQITKPLLYP
jgi:integrase